MSYQHIEVKPTSGFTGAEISGVDLSRPLSDEAVAEIHQALLQWKVVFFRNQNIDHAAQIAFTARFGEVTISKSSVCSIAPRSQGMFRLDQMVSDRRWLKVSHSAVNYPPF